MGNSLDELASYFRPQAQELLDDCATIGIPCRVVDTGRTPTEQEAKLAQGVSWTSHSKHEPQPPEGKSEAIDIVPEAILEEHKSDWDPSNPLWLKIGEIGERLGMEWGGRWVHVNGGKGDPSHFQYVPQPAQILTDTELSTT
jgi:hypothetical protein